MTVTEFLTLRSMDEYLAVRALRRRAARRGNRFTLFLDGGR